MPKTKSKTNEAVLQKVRFSIGTKLVTIITILVLLSLGLIITLVSWLVQQELRITAEETNFEVNRHLANETEYTLRNLRANSLVIMRTIQAAGVGSNLADEVVDFFFEQNPHVVMLAFTNRDGSTLTIVNQPFFYAMGIDISLVDSYNINHWEDFNRAAEGETLFLNAAPHFVFPLLALFFPRQEGGAAVLFSAESLSESFGFGTNRSFLINNAGDLLIHADNELIRDGENMANRVFIQDIRENPLMNLQIIYTDEDIRYFGAFTKINLGASIVITSIEHNRVFEGLFETTLRHVYLTAAILFISIMFIYFFSKSISLPLQELASAAQNIEGGVFEIDIQSKRRDEIGILTHSFQSMCAALSIFGKFTNKDLAVRAMRGELKPGGLTKHATIFFSDIRGFTEKSESFTREFGDEASDKIVFWLNNYLSHMVECVEKTGGVVDKFIGDAVMAHWGTAYTEGSVKDDALNCVKAALMMRTAIVKINGERQVGDLGNPEIAIGIGINTGIVTAGQIGSDLRMEYTVIGDPVNLASRVEALNVPLGTDILIAEDTWNLVKDDIIAEEMPFEVRVKGKEKPLRVFAVIKQVGEAEGPDTLEELRELLGIKEPDIFAADTDFKEAKYRIS